MHLYTVFSLQSFFSLLELQSLLFRDSIYFQIADVGILLCVHFVEMGTKTIMHFKNVMQCFICNLYGLVNILLCRSALRCPFFGLLGLTGIVWI